jgi:hypothetical protein
MTAAVAESEVAAFASWLAAQPGHTIIVEALALAYFRGQARRRLAIPGDVFVRDWRASVPPPLALAAD